MTFEQRVGEGWRCDGCGKVERWGPGWGYYGSIFEAEEGILRWVACSEACYRLMPEAAKTVKLMTSHGQLLDCAELRIKKARERHG